MNYIQTELEQEVYNTARELAQKKLKNVRAKLDEEETYSEEVMELFKKAGLCAIWLPKKYGGLGGGVTCLALCIEQIASVCGGLSLCSATSALGSMPMVLWATAEQRERWMPPLAAGEKHWAFALTEPDAGSDATALKTTAVKDGDHYVINGSKHYISSGKLADFYTVAVSTNPARGARGISMIVVEKGTPGFTFGKKEHKLGMRTNPTYELNFQDVRVPVSNLLGGEGKGLLIVQETLDYSRPGVSAQSIGIAQGALDETIPYLRTRRQFGQPVSSFQALQHTIADLTTQVEAGRALTYKIANEMDKEFLVASEKAVENGTTIHDELKKVQNHRWTKYSSMAKLFGSETAFKVAEQCINLCGGIGYMRDFPVEKYMRDAKLTQIYEGTNHIQRNEIAAAVIKEYAGVGE
ncbi:Acyl-CoA dehydrogenase [Parelusimicrobium proximum]|uniref:acyl-CoA dehydrogenase family protein n=1 Tax=Parelusimicrobium proximum TaxID=3228953 RepID=UPI003D16F9F8